MKLVIVESPTKARTLSRFLGSDFQIMASMGHIRDLPKDKLGIEVDNNFRPEYVLAKEKQKIISELKKASVKAEEIILATDPDREGEAIAWHIAYLLKKKPAEISRIVFHEITQSAIKQALKNPGDINQKLVDAQQTRRVLDRLVGYKLSPLLWAKVRRGLSAGRVQSIAVRLIVEREREIEQFNKINKKSYWTIGVSLGKVASAVFETTLSEKNGQKYEKTTVLKLFAGAYSYKETNITNKAQALKIINDLKKQIFVVSDIVAKQVQRHPYAPLTTSTLQQAASHALGLSSKRTMQLAQQLYEKGLISYHRTDSTVLSTQAIKQIREHLLKTYGKDYLPATPRIYQTKTKNAQEAHEAIRPTNISQTSQELAATIDKTEAALYDLIYRRTLACQMASALFSQTNLKITAGSYLCITTGTRVVFDGFLKLYPRQLKEKNLPSLTVGDRLQTFKFIDYEHQTQPPPRYNEASLIKTLEIQGIGRPSTYAPIISLIQTRQYVEKKENYFVPTSIGKTVNDFLVKNFSDIINIPFTAQMEDDLDNIATGVKEWVPVIKDFYQPFAKKLIIVAKTAQRERIPVETTGKKCPLCVKGEQVIRIGRFGKFLSCSMFPECKWKAVYIEKLEGVKCLECGGDVIIRKTKRGKRFYGCSNWPKCKWASWRKPK